MPPQTKKKTKKKKNTSINTTKRSKLKVLSTGGAGVPSEKRRLLGPIGDICRGACFMGRLARPKHFGERSHVLLGLSNTEGQLWVDGQEGRVARPNRNEGEKMNS